MLSRRCGQAGEAGMLASAHHACEPPWRALQMPGPDGAGQPLPAHLAE